MWSLWGKNPHLTGEELKIRAGILMVNDIFEFKSIQMAREVTLAGDFIFTSAKKAMQLTSVHNEFDINAILYNGSVGVERLQKIYLYLCMDNPFENHDDLKTHNHCELEKRVADESGRNLYDNGKKLISKFNEYYGEYRYGNYAPVPKAKTIVDLFITFIKISNAKLIFMSRSLIMNLSLSKDFILIL